MSTTDAAKPAEVERREVHWQGRVLHASEPTAEQITVIYRLAKLRPSSEVSASRQLATLNRAPSLLAAVLPDEEWDAIEDDMINGTVRIETLPEAFAEVVVVWASEENRATRRAVAKKTTARRRATT